jgi:SAM-dependent methyltransferase
VVDRGANSRNSRNRAVWAEVNARFTDADADARWQAGGATWGLFRRSERQLALLGDVRDLDVIELGCGTAYLSAALALAGARVVAVDLSREQMATARRCQRSYGPAFPLVEADADQVPLRGGCVDLVVSEYGAAPWCDPEAWVPEAARLLRPGGRLVFLTNSVLAALCVPSEEGPAGDRLLRAQWEVASIEWSGGGREHHPSHGDWIDVLRRNGFVVDALHELFPPADADDPEYYEIVSAQWANRWPAEDVWVAHRG